LGRRCSVALTNLVSTPTKLSRVLLVDDHPAVLRQVTQLLSGEFEVVGALPDGRDLQQAVKMREPDLVVLDISLPGASGIELARKLAATPAPPRIVFLTVHADPDYAREALAAGALGYVVKSRLASDLVPALHAALEGSRFISPSPGLEELG
jgi:DNA-binding NarL/FixJ family response regulator